MAERAGQNEEKNIGLDFSVIVFANPNKGENDGRP
jgi:hypothetical protein